MCENDEDWGCAEVNSNGPGWATDGRGLLGPAG